MSAKLLNCDLKGIYNFPNNIFGSFGQFVCASLLKNLTCATVQLKK
jgi:hypothetical protein